MQPSGLRMNIISILAESSAVRAEEKSGRCGKPTAYLNTLRTKRNGVSPSLRYEYGWALL